MPETSGPLLLLLQVEKIKIVKRRDIILFMFIKTIRDYECCLHEIMGLKITVKSFFNGVN